MDEQKDPREFNRWGLSFGTGTATYVRNGSTWTGFFAENQKQGWGTSVYTDSTGKTVTEKPWGGEG